MTLGAAPARRCIACSEPSWPDSYRSARLAATAPGATAVGWCGKDLVVCMPGGAAADSITLEPVRARAG